MMRLITSRFGEPTPATASRIQDADLPALKAWFDRALVAESLSAVFDD